MHTQSWQIRLVVSLLMVLSGLLGLPRLSPAHVTEFTCAAGDVACLIDAINQANGNGEANTITLEAGTYALTEVNNDTDGPNGLPSVTGVVVIQGAGADTTIIERATDALGFRLIHIAATGVLTLEGLTLRRGGDRPFFGMVGGGLFNRGTLGLSRTTIADHDFTEVGGLVNRGGTVTIAASKFVNNVGFFSAGGAWNAGGTLSITETTFADNVSEGAGGILNSGSILFNEDGEGGTVILTNSTLDDNFGDGGGGIANRNGTVVLTNSTITRNTGRLTGGGLHNSEGGTVILTNSTVADNGIIANHEAGLRNEGTAVLTNTILARNQTLATGFDCSGSVTSLGHNLIGDPTGCTITLQPTDLTGDPGLGDFTDDGTPGNGHVPLVKGSPAINAGNDAFCPPTDQLGQPRVRRCDIGAVEFQPSYPAAARR